MICDCRTDAAREAEAVEFLFRRRVDGLILMPSGKSGKHLERFLHVGKPVVLIDRNLEDVPCDSVLVDNRGAAQAAVERLFLAGHRKIGMIAGPEHVFTARERYLGYEEAFKKGRNRSTGFIGCAWRLYDRRRCQGDEGACKTESADDSSFCIKL